MAANFGRVQVDDYWSVFSTVYQSVRLVALSLLDHAAHHFRLNSIVNLTGVTRFDSSTLSARARGKLFAESRESQTIEKRDCKVHWNRVFY